MANSPPNPRFDCFPFRYSGWVDNPQRKAFYPIRPILRILLGRNSLQLPLRFELPTNSFDCESSKWGRIWCSGFSLFLAFMIDRLHHYIRELSMRRKTMEAVKKQNRTFEDGKTGASEEIKTLEEEASALRGKIKQLESELQEKAKEASGAEANAVALKKQSEGFLLEYDRLLEENQNLRSQLQSLDRTLSRSDNKKVS